MASLERSLGPRPMQATERGRVAPRRGASPLWGCWPMPFRGGPGPQKFEPRPACRCGLASQPQVGVGALSVPPALAAEVSGRRSTMEPRPCLRRETSPQRSGRGPSTPPRTAAGGHPGAEFRRSDLFALPRVADALTSARAAAGPHHTGSRAALSSEPILDGQVFGILHIWAMLSGGHTKRHVIIGRYGLGDRNRLQLGEGEIATRLDLIIGDRALDHGVGRTLVDLSRLGVYPTEIGVDVLVLAAHVHAADTRVSRDSELGRWTREYA